MRSDSSLSCAAEGSTTTSVFHWVPAHRNLHPASSPAATENWKFNLDAHCYLESTSNTLNFTLS